MAKKKEVTEVATAPASTMVDDNRKTITEILLRTHRDGIEDLLDKMDEMGFFTAPASGGNHLHMECGLAQHSLNVAQAAEKIGLALLGAEEFNKVQNSIMTCALLHDLGKCGDWGKQLYVENILKTGKRSEAKPWKRNPDLTNIPHGVRSVLITEKYLFDLTEDEEYAIMYHDGLYEPSNVAVVKGHESVLYMILHWADMWASKVMEGGDDSGED
jgi:23S rRNA maturation-related 3'-5' exoribonuclease YhaM